MKDLTGGDNIRARRMRENFWEFEPTHKVWMVGNHKPIIRGTDTGIWRRMKLIPYNRTFTIDEQDKDLFEKLQAELSGIMLWAIDGCLKWQAGGLEEPELISRSSSEYREEQDTVAIFIQERCIESQELKVKAGLIYEDYKSWCQTGGEKPISIRTFGEELEKKYKRHRSNGNWYLGISLVCNMSDPNP